MTSPRTLLSLSVLAFALMTTVPAQAAVEPASASASVKKAPAKKVAEKKTDDKKTGETTKSTKKTTADETASKTKGKATETADARPKSKKSDPKKTETAAATPSKKSKTVAADEKTTKSSSSAKKSKTSELADAKPSRKKTSDDETPAKAGKKTEVADTKTKSKKTQLADAEPSKKGKSAAKPTEKADAKPATKVAATKPAAPTKTAKSGNIVSDGIAVVATAVTSLPVFQKPEPVMNAAPVPYHMVAGQGTPVAPTPLNTTLAANDTQLYQTAFTLIEQGDYAGADAQLALVTDRSLMGYAQYHKLFSRNYASTYEELTAWLNVYGDHPQAMKVWNLAKRKKPDGMADPAFPRLAGGNGVQLAASTALSTSTPVAGRDALTPGEDSLTPKSARSAYNNGQLEQAVKLGRKIGDHWVAGLASWRLKRYDEALAEFQFVSSDPSANAWTQASGAYWAARCAQKLGKADEAETYLQLAASYPFTFYGLLAETRLGVTPAVQLAQKGLPPTFSRDQRSVLTASLSSDFTWTTSNPRAQRLNALVQIGRTSDAKDELQAAIQSSVSGEERDQWLAFGARTHVPYNALKPTDRLFDVSLYPLPDFAPRGGFTVDKALLFAIARKESKFDAQAYSYAGAYGLMQLMPATAALVEGDNSFNTKPKQLLTPSVNMRVGQNYIMRLQGSSIIDGDLLRTIAAYNAGARPVKDAVDSLGADADSLLVMESIPVAQTRQYVEEVVANYWIYRQIMGKDSKTLIQAASDARIIDLTADSPKAAEVAMTDK